MSTEEAALALDQREVVGETPSLLEQELYHIIHEERINARVGEHPLAWIQRAALRCAQEACPKP